MTPIEALEIIKGIAKGSTTANSLPHIAKIAAAALSANETWLRSPALGSSEYRGQINRHGREMTGAEFEADKRARETEISRETLFHPNLAKPREIWVFPHNIVGAVAMFAVAQSPYPVPDNLETVLRKLHQACDGFNEDNMRLFASHGDLERYVRDRLRAIPEYHAWNERKNGNQAPLHFTSRYDGPGNPDDDFIDLGALERNVANHIVQQSILL